MSSIATSITGNRVGVVVRPADPSPIVRLTRNRISGNGQEIRRCEAGGSCDAAAPKGAMAFGVPGLEHESFVGSRGRGVTVNPATIQFVCPSHAPNCQGAPNAALKTPMLVSARPDRDGVALTGTFNGAPTTRYLVELFGNSQAGSSESGGLHRRRLVRDRRRWCLVIYRCASIARGVARLQSITATITSPDGATSPLSAALPLEDLSR